ncbi:MAG: hypothetical protein DHS20C01_31820 [marine bacterium B5-7]|nr:MAG: hypothetical protein DHS20C01_31820 [marine bacterium B5-7]
MIRYISTASRNRPMSNRINNDAPNEVRSALSESTIFYLYLIAPSHYTEDGYVIFWDAPPLSNNTLACLNGLALDCARRKVLGQHVTIEVVVQDESTDPIPSDEIIERIGGSRRRGMVALTGVQSHQYPRALDLARQLRNASVPVCMGGFHVTGVLAMLAQPTAELHEAMDLGVSLFCGEAEGGRLDEVLRDAYDGNLKSIYARPSEPPGLEGEPGPSLPNTLLKKTRGVAPFDAGRGCPFVCSFCTIINVHGKGGRQRRVEDVIATMRVYLQQGVRFFQVTDDNFSRLANWRELLNAIAELRRHSEREFGLLIQVDVPSYRKKGFVELCAAAGVHFVFVGVESVNEENLQEIVKKQNRAEQYRDMFRAWRKAGIHVQAGYILGFSADTPESIDRDVRYLLDEIQFDDVMFFYMTHLPGSANHRDALSTGEWLDPDLNRYTLHHPVKTHPTMSSRQWKRAYRRAWRSLVAYHRIPGYLRAAQNDGLDTRLVFSRMVGYRLSLFWYDIHPIEFGLGLRKVRTQKRSGFPIKAAWMFWIQSTTNYVIERTYLNYLHWRIGRIYRRTLNDTPPLKAKQRSLATVLRLIE